MNFKIAAPRFTEKFNEALDILEKEYPVGGFSVLVLTFLEVVRIQAKASNKTVREMLNDFAEIDESMEKRGLL